jgi:uncharacterized protein YbcI
MEEGEAPRASLPPTNGELMQAIADAVVRIHRKHTGRGAARAQALCRSDVVVVIMRDALTQAETTLVNAGRDQAVSALRRALQQTMRVELVAAVELLTSGTVEACMGATSVEPDMSAEIFVLGGPVSPSP